MFITSNTKSFSDNFYRFLITLLIFIVYGLHDSVIKICKYSSIDVSNKQVTVF